MNLKEKENKIQLSAVGKLYTTRALLINAHTCLYNHKPQIF